jgi:N-glycosylase/DNA lyase
MTFNLQHTLESGQIFRYKIREDKAIVAHGKHVFTLYSDGTHNHPDQEWASNFLRADQPELSHNHPYVQEAIDNTKGIRILRQDPWECLIAFIISQNNHQKRIQQNVLSITEAFGRPIAEGFYSLPQPEDIGTEEELRELGLGYRAKHIAALKDIDIDWLYNLKNLEYEEAKTEIQKLSGVGPKVADCILLFSLGFEQACPEDTWIKKIFTEHQLTAEDLGEKAGLIQQSLFHYARTNN